MIDKHESAQEREVYLSFDYALAKIREEIHRALSSQAPLIRQFTGYLGRSEGKNIRAKALLICAMSDNGKIHPDAVNFAVATELLHLATLVHDDVIDDSDLRRGAPTLQKKFGKKTAVICGDLLLCIALKTIASAKTIRDFTVEDMPDYVRRICAGELDQHLNNYNYGLTVREYLRIISGKTAALFEASYYGGMILCKEERSNASVYRKLGRYTGMIFQLMDDCADFEEETDSEKKPVRSDFEQGVITLPMIIALRNPSLRKRAEERTLSVSNISDAVKKAGGITYTKLMAGRYYNKARGLIDELDIGEKKREMLLTILNKSFRYKKTKDGRKNDKSII